MKYHIFGDTGGHYVELRNGLEAIGVDCDNYYIPENTTIVHVGDLIHKGPHTDELIAFLDKLMDKNPGRWIQIFGNHEYHHIPGGVRFLGDCSCSRTTKTTLKRWLKTGKARAAYAITDANLKLNVESPYDQRKDFLVVHGGMRKKFWANHGHLTDIQQLVNIINALPVSEVTIPGELLNANTFQVGPVWATQQETFSSWNIPMPYHQIVGHTAVWAWNLDRWWNPKLEALHDSIQKFSENKTTVSVNRGTLLIGVDPANEKNPTTKAQPCITLETKN